MGLFICKMCDVHADIFSGGAHVCKSEDIIKHVERLEDERRLAQRHVSEIQNSVFMVLQELPSLEGDITVNAEWLRKLWEAAKCPSDQMLGAKTPENFLVRWLATHRVLCEAYDVFRSKKFGHVTATLKKLQDLRKYCDESKKVLGYEDTDFDLSPVDVLKNYLKEIADFEDTLQ